MKILFVSHCADINGAPLSMVALINELKKLGVDAVVAMPCKGKLESLLRLHHIKYYILDYKRSVYRLDNPIALNKKMSTEASNFKTVLPLAKIVVKEHIDVIHSNSSVVDVGAMTAFLLRKKHIWHFREFGEEDGGISFIWPLKQRWLAKKAARIIVISKAVEKKYGDWGKCALVYNGLEISKCYIERTKLLEKPILNFVIAGTIVEKKGQEQAVLACGELLKRNITNFHLSIVGSGNAEYLRRLRREVKELKLAEYVSFEGFQRDMLSVRKRMDVQVVCSKAEAFGRVTVEGMLGGLLVIASNTGGTVEIIRDGENGVLYQEGNHIELSEKLQDVLQNPQNYRRMIKRGQQEAEKAFNIQRTAKEVADIYDQI